MRQTSHGQHSHHPNFSNSHPLRHHPKTGPYCGTSPNSKRWLSNDCCGWVCASLTWIFLLYASYVVYFVILLPWQGNPFWLESNFWGYFHYIGFYTCIFLAFWSHLKTMLTDPGAVPLDAIPLDYYDNEAGDGLKRHHDLCKHCTSFKPRTAHHCSICSRCIVRM
jgi:hypothetical protein